MSGRAAGEFGLIDWIRARRSPLGPGEGVVGDVGDDCATLQFREPFVLVTTDMLMDGRHFILDRDGPEAAGYKAMGVNISDIAAMCGVPRFATVAVALPRRGAAEIGRGLDAGLRRMADRFGVHIVGGDTNAWDGPLVVGVTLLGETAEPDVARRSGAKVGDAIFVTGPLGGSLHRGRHLRPEPRVREALAIRDIARPTAMIDLSDGLSSDLSHILAESGGLGALLDAEAIPVHPDAVDQAAADGHPAIRHALNDGEDFELCFTVARDSATRVASETGARRIGEVVADPGIRLRWADGGSTPIEAEGFDHFREPPAS